MVFLTYCPRFRMDSNMDLNTILNHIFGIDFNMNFDVCFNTNLHLGFYKILHGQSGG